MRKTTRKPRTQKRTRVLSLAFACAALAALAAFAAVAFAQQPPQQQRKRVTPLKTSDAAQGSRVTITSDSNLSDYRAYRSGDRFVVIVPQAEGGGGEGARGRGFEGAHVSRNGNDLVYTFKLAPGASAKVNQRFNRLDVQFTAPKDASAQTSQTPAATPRVAPEISGIPSQANANARANANSQTATNASALGAATNRNTAATNPNAVASNPNEVSPSPTFGASPSPAPSASPSVQPVASPAVATAANDQLAQAQPPAPVSAVSTSTGAQTATLGATIQRNWYWIVAALLVVGVGLLIFSRAGEREDTEPPPALKSPAPPTARKVSAETSTAKLEARAATAGTIRAGKTAPDRTAAASAKPSSPNAQTAQTRAAGENGISDGAKKIAGAAALGATAVAAGSVASKRAQEKPAAADTERVGEELGKLFAGAPYDESVVGARDAATREMVASELLAALSSRHPQRNARAREAFLKHGYFDDATRDLQSGEAPARRASSAQALALLHDRAATPHLVAALDDPAPDVRRASVEALTALGDPAALEALEALRWRETSRQVPRTLIQHAVETLKRAAEEQAPKSATVAAEETIVAGSAGAPAGAAPPATEAAQPATELAPPATEVTERETGAAATAKELARPAGDATSRAVEAAPVEAAAPGVGEVAPEVEEAATRVEATAPSGEAGKLPFAEPAFAESAVAPSVETFAPAFEAGAGEPAVAREPAESPVDESSVLDLSHVESHAAPPVAESRADQSAERGEAVYTLDEEKAAAWSARREEAGESAATQSHRGTGGLESSARVERFEPSGEAAVSQVYAAPEFAVAPGAGAADEWLDAGVEEKHLSPSAEGSEASRAASRESVASEAAPSAVERPQPHAPETAQPVAPPTAAAEDRASSGFASNGENAGAGATLAEKGIELSGVAPEDVSIIPKAIQLRLASDDAAERAASVRALAHLDAGEAFQQICVAFDDPSQMVRDAAARALYDLSDDRAETFTRALRESSPERRRQIGASLASSGLADEAVSQLTGESRERTYDSFSLLFLMAKAGETAPLIRAVESHADSEVRLAVVKLLALSGQQEVLPSFRRLAVRGSLPTEVRAAVMEAIYQISSAGTPPAPKPTRTVS